MLLGKEEGGREKRREGSQAFQALEDFHLVIYIQTGRCACTCVVCALAGCKPEKYRFRALPIETKAEQKMLCGPGEPVKG